MAKQKSLVPVERIERAILARFPDDFMFQLKAREKSEVVANCDHLSKLKFSSTLPYALKGIELLPDCAAVGREDVLIRFPLSGNLVKKL